MIALPAAAPHGTEDTVKHYKAENVSLGDASWSNIWGPIVLNDGTKVEFAQGRSGYGSIKVIHWVNLWHCKYLNLGLMYALTAIELTHLPNLRVLNILYTAIKQVDLTVLAKLELVICGCCYNNGMQ